MQKWIRVGPYLKELKFSGQLNVSGSYMWGCCIAVFRVLYIKEQSLLKTKVGVKNLLSSMIIFGLGMMTAHAVLFTMIDKEITFVKMCTHQSNEDIRILNEFKVTI